MINMQNPLNKILPKFAFGILVEGVNAPMHIKIIDINSITPEII